MERKQGKVMSSFEQDAKTMSREELEYWAIEFLKHAQRVDEVLEDMFGEEVLYEVAKRIVQRYGHIRNYGA